MLLTLLHRFYEKRNTELNIQQVLCTPQWRLVSHRQNIVLCFNYVFKNISQFPVFTMNMCVSDKATPTLDQQYNVGESLLNRHSRTCLSCVCMSKHFLPHFWNTFCHNYRRDICPLQTHKQEDRKQKKHTNRFDCLWHLVHLYFISQRPVGKKFILKGVVAKLGVAERK